jgi:hypothetical protein
VKRSATSVVYRWLLVAFLVCVVFTVPIVLLDFGRPKPPFGGAENLARSGAAVDFASMEQAQEWEEFRSAVVSGKYDRPDARRYALIVTSALGLLSVGSYVAQKVSHSRARSRSRSL